MPLLNLAKRFFRIWKFMNARQKLVERRKDESVSPKEYRAVKLVLKTCSNYRSQ
jgi:hypothetical protein